MLPSLLLSVTLGIVAVFGQNATHPRRCAAEPSRSAMALAEQQFHERRDVSTGLHVQAIPLAQISVDVHWHVIRENDTEVAGNLPDYSVNASIDIMNYYFKDAAIHWNLVNVSRVTNKDWFINTSPNSTHEFEMKQALRQGTNKVLNIYSVENYYNTAFGWATFPFELAINPLWMDGVVIRHSTATFAGKNHESRGATLVHEVGHWCGLYHVFQDGCSGPGDYVEDTPPQEAQYECFVPRPSTCIPGAWDPLFNIMDYTSDCCQRQFTPGQFQRMREQLEHYRGL
ncbi:hypothetical protein ONZ45_g335 [Pleurotus djamor]|nr:hypothetical protein ONZ45_g335 [Pleurotus djamor]